MKEIRYVLQSKFSNNFWDIKILPRDKKVALALYRKHKKSTSSEYRLVKRTITDEVVLP